MSFSGLPNNPSNQRLEASGFWPELQVAEFQAIYRLPGEYTGELLLDHLADARNWAVRLLEGWAAKKQTEGFAQLAAVPFAGLPGEALRIFKKAVFCQAKGLLLPQFATIDRREAARNEAKEAPESADIFFARANNAIADLLGTGRIKVAAI